MTDEDCFTDEVEEYAGELQSFFIDNILDVVVDDVFSILYMDKNFMHEFNRQCSEIILKLKKDDYPNLLREDGVIERISYYAKCITVRYEAGEYYLKNGVKGGATYGCYYKNGKYHKNRGFGWESVYAPSRLILVVEIEGKRTEIWIDRFFKERVGRLTNNRICKIVGAMPNFVEVKNMGNYYLVQDSSLEAWLMSAEI